VNVITPVLTAVVALAFAVYACKVWSPLSAVTKTLFLLCTFTLA